MMLPEPDQREVILKHKVAEAYHDLVGEGWDGIVVAAELERFGAAQRRWYEKFDREQ